LSDLIVGGIVYIVDAADIGRFQEAKTELDEMMAMEDLSTVPFLILGNKIDIRGAVSEDQLRHSLGLFQTTGKVYKFYIARWKDASETSRSIHVLCKGKSWFW
jgi:signal recognition particle receptor subunit beta